MKELKNLDVEDFERFPVWEFKAGTVNDDEYLEPSLAPVTDYPISDLRNRLVGCRIQLRNSKLCWAILGNVSLHDAHATGHFLTLSVEHNGQRYDLARYHDVNYEERGPAGLARFFGLPISAVVPMTYEISAIVAGGSEVTTGYINASPTEILSDDELVDLALNS
jgi:hypothetical protein